MQQSENRIGGGRFFHSRVMLALFLALGVKFDRAGTAGAELEPGYGTPGYRRELIALIR